MTIEQFCTKVEALVYSEVMPEDAKHSDIFFQYEWDSETYWIKLGLPEEWFDHEDE